MVSMPKELPSEGQEHKQDTEMEEQPAAMHEQTLQEETQLDSKEEEKQEQKKEDEDEKQKQETPAKPAQSVAKKTPSQTISATKRKFDALHARNAAADPSISEHEKNKKARASTLIKTPGTKPNRSAKTTTKAGEFSFARPTQSSSNRTAAAAKEHARAKPTPLSARKPIDPKRTLTKPQRASVPARTAPAIKDKEERPHFNYTPYSGPLPPLTVESSFAPKGSQNLDHGPRTASPAKTKLAAIARKPRPASAKKTKPQSTTDSGGPCLCANKSLLVSSSTQDSPTAVLMARTALPPTPKNWIRHQVGRRVRPDRSSTCTTSRTASSVRSAHDTALHLDNEACEPSQRRKWRRLSKTRQGPALWYQSRVFFAALFLILVMCVSWTCWLLLLTVAPNETINYIMQTTDLDNGSFWLLVEPTPRLRALTIAGLLLVALGYFYIGALLLGWGRQRTLTAAQSGPAVDQLEDPLRLRRDSKTRSTGSLASIYPVGDLPDSESDQLETTGLVRSFFSDLCIKDSEARKIVRVGVKMLDLMLQEFVLHQILEAGFPLPLVISCTLMIVWNAFAVAGLMLSPIPPSQIGEAFVDSVSDLLVSILFPVLVLTYCLATFEFDRASQALMADLFPRWSFQNAARVHANPEQIAKIVKSLDGLRFLSIEVWIARMGNNLALLISLRRLMRLLRAQTPPKVIMNSHLKTKRSIYPREHPLASVFVVLAVATVVFVAVSVHRSQKACASFPTCTMHAHRWWLSSSTLHESESGDAVWNCPCRVLVDADLSPANFSVWRNPPDVTSVVSDLAASGDLEILQLINRQLHILPDSLRNCTRMKHIALVFTHTITLPRWAAEFTNLEFLHIQGKDRCSLVSLPQGLFANMTKLTFLHLGAHAVLRQLPGVSGLKNLKSITLARMDSMDTLPADFSQLEHLEIVLALMIPNLTTFPDLSSARRSLKTLVVDAGPLCCNGFLQTGCDLTSPTCGLREFEESEERSCLPDELTATIGTQEIFQAFNSTICVTHPAPPPPNLRNQTREPPSDSSHSQGPDLPSEEDRDAELEQNAMQCGGILFRECSLSESRSGICYSDRFMPITCIKDPSTIEFRRQQINRHIGPKCNVQYEAWLGCSG